VADAFAESFAMDAVRGARCHPRRVASI
jgi:hypothetical protein